MTGACARGSRWLCVARPCPSPHSGNAVSLRGHPLMGPPGLWGQGHGNGGTPSGPTEGGEGTRSLSWLGWFDKPSRVGVGGWWWQENPVPSVGDTGDTHSRQGEITALLYHVVTPAGGWEGRTAAPPAPAQPPRAGAVRTPSVCTAGAPRAPRHGPGAGREQGRDKGGTAGGGGAVGQRGGHPQPFATPNPLQPQALSWQLTGKGGSGHGRQPGARGEGRIRGLDRSEGSWGAAGNQTTAQGRRGAGGSLRGMPGAQSE